MFSTYGNVFPQVLCELNVRVKALSFPPQESVDTIFVEIDNLTTIVNYDNALTTASWNIIWAIFTFRSVESSSQL